MARAAEYIDPRAGVDAPAIAIMRAAFLDCVAKAEPRVLEELRNDLLPLYRAAWNAAENEHLPRREWWAMDASFWRRDVSTFVEDHPAAAGYARLVPLYESIAAWRERWNLLDDWALDAALATMYDVTTVPRMTLDQWRPTLGGGPEPESPIPPPFVLPTCELLHETWESYEKRVKRALEHALNQYHDIARAWAEQHGLEPAPEKRRRRDDSALLHFEMLARFQCCDWTHAEVGTYYGKHPATVADALRETAKMIGLKRRTLTPE